MLAKEFGFKHSVRNGKREFSELVEELLAAWNKRQWPSGNAGCCVI